MNDPSFLNRTDVNEQDAFFHRFFVERARRDDLKGIRRNNSRGNDDDYSGNDDDIGHQQDDAFDAAEHSGGLESGGKSFEEYEAMWETDDEEEGFVDSLAISLMDKSPSPLISYSAKNALKAE